MAAKSPEKTGFLTSLLHNQAGNTLFITAAATFPLIALVGGGIDMSRLYLTQSRLQHACDAGALAGRKQMGAGAWNASSGKANTVALQLFDANFGSNPYGTTSTERSFTESDGQVNGTASVTVPMTVMHMLGQATKTLTADCQAEMRIPNTDVMFVLDVTGSMNQKANSTDSVKKIDGLKSAVLCFYEALAKLDTDENCGTTPTGSNSSSAQIRFGFVPYSVNVNVGKLLKNDWIADNWTYQSRTKGNKGWGDWYSSSVTIGNNGSCPLDTTTIQYRNTSTSGSGSKKKCNYEYRSYGPLFIYKPVSLDVSALKKGGADSNEWNGSVNLPIGTEGANRSVTWDGCIEERETVRATNYYPIPSTAKDLDIDLIPSKTDSTTQWGPLLPGAMWIRTDSSGNYVYNDLTTDADKSQPTAACPTEAKKLQTWPLASKFEEYVKSLTPNGNTYHDIGLLWGARLASPTGLFSDSNATTPTGGQIDRHIIFMTDGETQTSVTNPTAYGMHWWDRRQTNTSSTPSNSDTDAQVNARFSALCTAIKNKGFTLWTIYFGVDVTDSSSKAVKDTANRLKTCASDNDHYFPASNSATLISTFRGIADNISQLRLTQ